MGGIKVGGNFLVVFVGNWGKRVNVLRVWIVEVFRVG